MAAPVVASVETQDLSGSTWTLTKPAAAAAGDLLVAIFTCGANSQSVSSAPAGWDEWIAPVGSGSAWIMVYTREVQAGDPASWDWSMGLARVGEIHLYRLTGHDSAAPRNTQAQASQSSSTSYSIPAVTPSVADVLLIACAGNNANASQSWTPDAAYTEGTDVDNGSAGQWGTGYRQVTGASGSYSATWTCATADNGNVVHLAVAGAAGGGATDVAGTDSGAGLEDASVAASDSATETGAGADAVEATVGPSAAETGAGADAASTSADVAGSDTGAGADNASVAATPPSVADTGAGADAATAGAPIDISETGAGADTVAAETGPGAATDTGVGADTVSGETGPPDASDVGSGSETAAITYAEQLVEEYGAATEAAVISQLASDLGIGADAVTLSFLAPPHWEILIEDELGNMVNRGEWVRPFPALSVEHRSLGGSGIASIPLFDTLRELNIDTERRVQITHDEVLVYVGLVRRVRSSDRGWSDGPVLYLLECQDLTSLLYDDVVETAVRTVAESDKARIAWLVNTFGTKGVVAGTGVTQLLASMPAGEDGRPEQDFGGASIGAGLEQIAKITGGRFYVALDYQLQYFAAEAAAAPFALSDQPDGSTSFGYGGLVLDEDSLAYYHKVLVVGTGVKLWRQLASLPSDPAKIRMHAIRDEEITTVAQAEAAGDAFLAVHGAHRRTARCHTYKAGLRAGMVVNLTHVGYGLAAEPFPIRSVRVSPLNAEEAVFQLELGDVDADLAQVVGGQTQTIRTIQDQLDQTAIAVREAQAAGANLVPDSSFEATTAAAWTVGTGWTHGFASASAFRGSKTARLNRSNASAGVLQSAAYIPVDRTSRYWLSVWSLLSSLGTNAHGEVRLLEYSSASSLLRTTVIAAISAVESAWTRHSAQFGPSDAVGIRGFHASTTKVKLEFAAAGSDTTPTITWEVDGAQFERGGLLTAYAPMPEELANVPGEVVIDASGVTIINGALTVKNPSGTVIIDGTSEMFKIQATGTYATTIASGGSGTTTFVDTGIANPADGSVPAFLAYLVEVGILNSRNIGSITAPPIVQYVASTSGGSPTTDVLVVRDWYTAGFERGTSTIRGYFRYNHRSAGDQNISLRWYVLKEAGI